MERTATATAIADDAIIRASLDRPETFGALFDRYADVIHAYASRRLGSGSGVADDVTADTFAIAFRKRDRYDLTRPDARPWLFGIAARQIADHRRAELRRLRAAAAVAAEPMVDDAGDRAADRASAAALRPALAAALAALSSGDRELLLLVAWAELTYPEAAEALGVPVGTVRSRLHRIRAKVRLRLGDVGGMAS